MTPVRPKRLLSLGLSLALAAATTLAVSETASAAGTRSVPARSEWSSAASAPSRAEAQSAMEGRIVGGAAAPAYPWMAEVILSTPDGAQELCGGTLVTPVLVMTAAHCVNGADGATVILGATSSTEGGTQFTTAAGYLDPSFNPDTFDNDWGFVVLETPAAGFTPLKIAGPSEGALWRTGRSSLVVGYGATAENGGPSPVVRQLSVPILADGVCGAGSSYGSYFHPTTMLCGGYVQGGADACQGDSGGPLAVAGDNGVWRLAGVVSFGQGCARPNFPGVYSRIADPAFSGRIQSQINAYQAAHPDLFSAAPDLSVIGGGAVPAGCTAAQAAFAPLASSYAAYAGSLAKVARAKSALKKAEKRARKARHNRAKAAKVHKLAKKVQKLKKKTRKHRKAGTLAQSAAATAISACS